MSPHVKNGDELVDFYLRNCDSKANLFEIWEDGGARGDSVTPSTYSPRYRRWMSDRLADQLTRNGGGLLSLGCGNAAVEADLVRQGFSVLAVDALEEAVTLAWSKGVDAVCADIYQWEPDRTWSVVYMDGVLGHLYEPERGLRPVLERVRSWMAPAPGARAATLIASNDAPKNDGPVQDAPGVNGFSWLSAPYMRAQALESGFDRAETLEFRYQRPLSGERSRAIIVGEMTG